MAEILDQPVGDVDRGMNPVGLLQAEAGLRQAEEDKVFLFSGWYPSGPPGLSMTEVTVDSDALEWTAERIREAVAGFLARLP